MNYIRGAVNAISAPYQYYKELPPINPSTLTGAIDVIVIQRPTDNGDTELVCSPFHVRFGKWQVLRPGEKKVRVYDVSGALKPMWTFKVSVSVNGHPIPFNMKIGEAGEAFFVFETDEDVPDDLITSPILLPTRPDEVGSKAGLVPDVTAPTDLPPELQPDVQDGTHVQDEDALKHEPSEDQEPDFFDLDAQPSKPYVGDESSKNPNATPRQSFAHFMHEQLGNGKATAGLPSPPPTPTHRIVDLTPEMAEQEQRVDEALKSVRRSIEVPEVDLHADLTFDTEGYHSRHDRERSDRTIRSSSSESFTFPSRNKSRSSTPSPVRGLGLDDLEPEESLPSSLTFPLLRAASEPPPDFVEDSNSMTSSYNQASSSKLKLPTLSPVQEYSWEWGAFPQPSPMNSTFSKSGRIEGSLGRPWKKGKGRANMKSNLSTTGVAEIEDGEVDESHSDHEREHGRSRSVPPELEGSPTRQRRVKELVEEDDYSGPGEDDDDNETPFGKGGILKPSKSDSSGFTLQIEGRRVTFELSIVSPPVKIEQHDGALSEPEESTQFEGMRGWRSRHGRAGSSMHGRDEVEATMLFELGKVDYNTFLEDANIVKDAGLVIRWADTQYITREDGSPLMQALIVWRDATLEQKALEPSSRSTSPVCDEEPNDAWPLSPPSSSDEHQPEERHHHRSKSEPPEKAKGKPTATSWVKWWRRSSRKTEIEEEELEQAPALKTERPSMRETTSAPLSKVTAPEIPKDLKRVSRDIPPAESAPAYPSTPVQEPVKAPVVPTMASPPVSRKYAKTLRLTSDQLVCSF
ncbi:hypothetical protein H0H87_008994 [Tephrocybe sp. NHM501043]|nr:hypothetical protein H0H87_008994 [Tephrocybe sp. NHM501043]